MPAYSKEKEEMFIAFLKIILVRNPSISILKAQEAMHKAGYMLDKDYVHKLMKKIIAERGYRYKNQTLPKEVAKFEDMVETLVGELWKIIVEKDRVVNNVVIKGASKGDKIRAIKEIIDAQKKLLDVKFDSGMFERQLGKITAELTTEEEELAKLAIDYATNKRKTKTDRTEPEADEALGE